MARNKIVGKNDRPGSNLKTGRDYSYDEKYEQKPKIKKYQAELHKKGRELLKKGISKIGDKKDISHKVAAKKGGTLKQGFKLEDQSKNRARK